MKRHPSGSRERDTGGDGTGGRGSNGGSGGGPPGGGGNPKGGGHSAPYQRDYRYVDRHKPQNRKPSASKQVVNQHLSVVYFSAQNDLSQPWFHRHISREAAITALQATVAGTFLIRPSSQRGNYALSWLDRDGRVRHNLICNKFPGYSLDGNAETYPNLNTLVDKCNFLESGLPLDANANPGPKEVPPTSSEDMLKKLVSELEGNSEDFLTLTWKLIVVEGADMLKNPARRNGGNERRTHVNYSLEEYTAPQLFRLHGPAASNIFGALAMNKTLRYIAINGHNGLMRINFEPNVGDQEASLLAEALYTNCTLTHLDLAANSIGDEGAKRIADVLRENKTLRKLVLRHNFIQRIGLHYLADALVDNNTLDDLQVGQQFRASGKETLIVTDSYHRALVALIEDSFKRKAELLCPTQYAPFFHGFLPQKVAEERLRTSPVGSYLFYLREDLPGVMMLAFVHSNLHAEDPTQLTIVLHKAVYRTDYGFSLSRGANTSNTANTVTGAAAPSYASAVTSTLLTAHHNSNLDYDREDHHAEPRRGGLRKYNSTLVLSLQEHVCWKLLGHPEKFEKARTFVPSISAMLEEMKLLPVLWQIHCVPRLDAPASFASSAFPTLAQFIKLNKSFLGRPVHAPLPAATPLSSSNDAAPAAPPTPTASAPALVHPTAQRRPVLQVPNGVHLMSPATTPPPPDLTFTPNCNIPLTNK